MIETHFPEAVEQLRQDNPNEVIKLNLGDNKSIVYLPGDDRPRHVPTVARPSRYTNK